MSNNNNNIIIPPSLTRTTIPPALTTPHYKAVWRELENQNYGQDDECVQAAFSGDLELLRRLYEGGGGVKWNAQTCAYSTCQNQLECLRFAHEHGCPWDERTPAYAAEGGHLACLQYAHENGCPWDEVTCTFAAKNGHLACLQYARAHDCPWDKDECLAAIEVMIEVLGPTNYGGAERAATRAWILATNDE